MIRTPAKPCCKLCTGNITGEYKNYRGYLVSHKMNMIINIIEIWKGA
jgi:hypothetical protein